MNFEFANPQLLYSLLIIPVLAILKGMSGKSASIIFSDINIVSNITKFNKNRFGLFNYILLLLALSLFITALARPRLGIGYSHKEESGIDMVLAVDVSLSMSARDFSTFGRQMTRLDAVKGVLEDFIEKRQNDRIGMIAFGTNSFLVSPITLNHDWLLKNIERLHLGIIDGKSTAIGSAIGMSVNRLRDIKNAKSKLVILLTDGENNAGQISPIAASEAAASYGVKIYTIAAGGVQSRMDEDTLEKIAKITGGEFFRARNLKQLEAIYDYIDKLEKTKVKLHNFTSYEELFRYFIFGGLSLLLLHLILANTRYRSLP